VHAQPYCSARNGDACANSHADGDAFTAWGGVCYCVAGGQRRRQGGRILMQI